MNKITQTARLLFAIAILALGIQHFIYAHFLPELEPMPDWLRSRTSLAYTLPAYFTGAFLVAVAVSLAIRTKDPLAAVVLGLVYLLNALLTHVPQVIADLHNGGKWTTCFEVVAISSGSLILAGIIKGKRPRSGSPGGSDRLIDKLIGIAPLLFASSLLVFAILHFVYADYIATLIPSWIPARLFWSYFVGFAFLASALSIVIKKKWRAAMLLLGLMFYLWVLILHIPRVIASPQIEAEWTSTFVALAFGSAAWLLEGIPPLRPDWKQ